jgi:hypothetical protein
MIFLDLLTRNYVFRFAESWAAFETYNISRGILATSRGEKKPQVRFQVLTMASMKMAVF